MGRYKTEPMLLGDERKKYVCELCGDRLEAFEVIMALAISHAFGCYNPKQWVDYLGIPAIP